MRQQQRGLLAALAREQVMPPQPQAAELPELAEQRIAGRVSPAIVDPLEVVDVDQDDRERASVTSSPGPFDRAPSASPPRVQRSPKPHGRGTPRIRRSPIAGTDTSSATVMAATRHLAPSTAPGEGSRHHSHASVEKAAAKRMPSQRGGAATLSNSPIPTWKHQTPESRHPFETTIVTTSGNTPRRDIRPTPTAIRTAPRIHAWKPWLGT